MMALLRDADVNGLCLVIELASCGGSLAERAQTTASPSNNQDLNGKIELLTRSLEQTQTELARSRSEIEQLRAMLSEVLKRMDSAGAAMQPQRSNTGAGVGTGAGKGLAPGPANAPQAAQISQDAWDLLNSRVQEH